MDTITKTINATKSVAASIAAAFSQPTLDPLATARALRTTHETEHNKHRRMRQDIQRIERSISEIDNLSQPTREDTCEREKLQTRLVDLLPQLAAAEAACTAAEPLPFLARKVQLAWRREEVNMVDWPNRRDVLLSEAIVRTRDNINKTVKACERFTADHAKRRAARTEGQQRLDSQITQISAGLKQAEGEIAAELRGQGDAYAAAARSGKELPDTEAQEEALAAKQRLAARLRARLVALQAARDEDGADHQRLCAEEEDVERAKADELAALRKQLQQLRWDIAAGDFLSVAVEMADAMPRGGTFAVPVFDPARVPGGCLMGSSDTATEHTLREMAEAMAAGCSVADVLDEIRAAGFGHLITKG